jgi:phage terminase large subunit-like protein
MSNTWNQRIIHTRGLTTLESTSHLVILVIGDLRDMSPVHGTNLVTYFLL